MNKNQNISQVVTQKLCNTCGACFAVCTSEAIKYQETVGGYYFPVVDTEACKDCGLCYSVCPGINFSDGLLKYMPTNPFTGQTLSAFVGRSTDKKLFDNSQSGGIVSALLVHALETGRIKGAVTVTMEAGTPPRPLVKIAKNSHEIFCAQKSKYCPVPLLGFLRDLKKGDGPVAMVGVSCQIHGLHNILDKIPKLKNKIAFTVGLVCERVMTYAALDFFVERSKIDKRTKVLLHYKDKFLSGYPGNVHVFSSNGNSVIIPSSVRHGIKDSFTPARCKICFDKMNVFSDITVGDPHGLEGVDRKLGESMLVVRTKIGQEIVESAKADAAIDIRPIEYGQVLKGQGISKKKEQWRGYVEAWKQLGRELPNYYAQVKNHASAPAEKKKFLPDLEYSLNLDAFASREELIRIVEKAVRKSHIVNRLLFPARLTKRILRKLLNLVVCKTTRM